MACRFSGLTVAALSALAALAVACDQPAPSAPVDGPMRSVGETDPFACIFKGNPSLSHSANSYFTVTADRQKGSDLISAMETAYDATPRNVTLTRAKGYELLTLVGLVSRQNTGSSPEVGELLTKQSFNCMYETGPNGADAAGFAGWPDDTHYDFSAALTPALGGAYYVKGGSSVSPAIGNLASLNTVSQAAAGNVSAIAPPSSDQWSEVLSQVAGNTVLFFGNTVTDGYDWKVLPRNASFTPYAVVALCPGVNGGQVYDGADMVFQAGVGVVGFEEVGTLCNINPAPPFAALYHPGGVFAALGRVLHSTGRWLSPPPLHASLATAVTIGGKVSGAKGDEFTFENVPTVVLDLNLADLQQPKNRLKVNSGRFSVTVGVTTPDGDPAGGITVKLSLTNNKGTPNDIFEIKPTAPAGYTGCGAPHVLPAEETTVATVGQNGETAVTEAKWTRNLCITKSGTVTVVASSFAEGNPDAAVASVASSIKIGVIP